MKEKNPTSRQLPKGDRLNWQALSDVKPVKLSNALTMGRLLSTQDLSNRNNNSSFPKNILVP